MGQFKYQELLPEWIETHLILLNMNSQGGENSSLSTFGRY